MMMKNILLALLFLPALLTAQTNTENWSKKTIYREPNGGRPAATVIYHDGLGRPIQQNVNKQSGSGKDIITHIEYENGRQLKNYLPYPSESNNMSYQSDAQSSTLNYSQYVGQYPFSEKILELSPSARTLKEGGPGADWQVSATSDTDHSIKMEYGTNKEMEVKNLFAATVWNSSTAVYDIHLQDKGFYSINQLYKTIIKDENWIGGKNNLTEEFKDKDGRLILRRKYENGAHDTYYVYDIYGNLTYVIPPLVTNPLSQLDDLCYQYKYDERNRLVEKKIPGKRWEYIVYDKLDRQVAIGPVLSPFGSNEIGYAITKYDALNRVVYTGWILSSISRNDLQQQYNGQVSNFSEKRLRIGASENVDNVPISYTNLAYPTNGLKLLTVSYYDDYNYLNAIALPSSVAEQEVQVSVTGLETGSWVRVLTNTSETLNEQGYILYNNKYQPIRTHTSNHYGGYTRIDSKLDFTGKILVGYTFHKLNSGSNELSTVDTYAYTDEDRLLLQTKSINGNSEQLISKYNYDELGRVVSKNVGGTDITGSVGLQKIDYRYNIHGWVTDVNNDAPLGSAGFQLGSDDLFGFKINYNKVTESFNGAINYAETSINGEVKPLYNGNIAETFWISSTDNQLRKYGYKYDNLNRLLKAFYQKPLSTVSVPGSYNEEISYDKNGNITGLKRKGNLDSPLFTIDIDDLTYTYNGNRLKRVDDATNNPEGFRDNTYGSTIDDYDYDNWGNITKDLNKGISSISYNHLNLPTEVVFKGGERISYLYNADGIKIQKRAITSDSNIVTDYQSGFQYENMGLKLFPHAEGYVNVTNGSIFNYVFNFVDHLGNIRNSWTWDDKAGSLQTIKENHYYAFGLKHKAYNNQSYVFVPTENGIGYYQAELQQTGGKAPVNPYRYQFNGKEEQTEFGIDLYDFGARNYDPAVGRWFNIDPLAEISRRYSPYSYALNNPVYLIDVDGMYADKPDRNDGVNYREEHWSDDTRGDSGGKKGEPKKETKSFANAFRQIASKISQWVDETVGDSARSLTDNTSQWASDFSDSHSSIGAGAIFQKHMVPAEGLLEMGLGSTGASLINSRGFVVKQAEKIVEATDKKANLDLARKLGKVGESAAGLKGSKVAIRVEGRLRYPDELTKTVLKEVKNVKHQNFTRQLRDYHQYSQEKGLQMFLYTRSNTTFSKPLKSMIDNGSIIRVNIPGH